MGSIRDKFVRETEEEKELYKTVQSFRSGNPFYSFSSQMDSTEKIHSFLEQKISSLVIGQVQLAGSRWSLHANEKQTKTYNIAGLVIGDSSHKGTLWRPRLSNLKRGILA